VAIVRGDGAPVTEARPGEEVRIVTNQTPFYGESGGQVGDTGTITAARGAVVNVTDTLKRLGDLHVHVGTARGRPAPGRRRGRARVDEARRDRIRRAHSATHLLHAALRRHLGDHVAQKGSLVAPDRLRFDFSHQSRSTPTRSAPSRPR
jgi:alanyl-tRNA synthetase